MEPFILEKQEPEEIDEATHAALDEGEADIARGDYVTMEQAQINLKERFKEWQEIQQKAA